MAALDRLVRGLDRLAIKVVLVEMPVTDDVIPMHPRGQTDYAHADHHALLMPAAVPGRIYDANDGGMDVSEDSGNTWANRSTGLVVTMFYDMDVAQSNGLVFGGGAQDNGTVVTTNGSAGGFFELLGGDGGWLVFDPKNAGHVYSSYYNLHIFRFRGGVNSDVSPPASEAEQGSVWMAFIAMDPSNSNTVFTGSTRVWRTKDDANSWTPVSPPLDGSPITAIEVAAADSKRVYVGTENGGIFRSINGGDSWSPNVSSSVLPGHTITPRCEASMKVRNFSTSGTCGSSIRARAIPWLTVRSELNSRR